MRLLKCEIVFVGCCQGVAVFACKLDKVPLLRSPDQTCTNQRISLKEVPKVSA